MDADAEVAVWLSRQDGKDIEVIESVDGAYPKQGKETQEIYSDLYGYL